MNNRHRLILVLVISFIVGYLLGWVHIHWDYLIRMIDQFLFGPEYRTVTDFVYVYGYEIVTK